MDDYIILGLIAFFLLLQRPGFRKWLRVLFPSLDPVYLPYHSKYILTSPEYRFYLVLKPMMDIRGYIICPKVGLKDLFEVNACTKDRQKHFRKISQKHIDFLICSADLRPIFAIELDDKSHKRADIKERDRFKDLVFESAGFPLYRIPTASSYTEEYICSHIDYYGFQSPEF